MRGSWPEPPGRRRAAEGQGWSGTLRFDVQIDDSGSDTWELSPEGMFAVDRNEQRLVEVVLEQYVIHLRLTRENEEPMRAWLRANGPNKFDGIARVGNRDVKIVATRR